MWYKVEMQGRVRQLVSGSIECEICRLILIAILLMSSGTLTAKQRFTAQQIVRYAKALDVTKLDPALPSQRLDEWLRLGPAHVDSVQWEMSDCDLKPDLSDPNNAGPLCAKVRFVRGNARGWLIIRVGTFRDGVRGTPNLDYIFIDSDRVHAPDSAKLSDLPGLLGKAASLTNRR
jgi:hypothetical protein